MEPGGAYGYAVHRAFANLKPSLFRATRLMLSTCSVVAQRCHVTMKTVLHTVFVNDYRLLTMDSVVYARCLATEWAQKWLGESLTEGLGRGLREKGMLG